MATLLERLKDLDDGMSRPVTMLEREVCGEVASVVEALLAAFEPFAAYMTGPTFDKLPPELPLSLGSPLARKQLTVADLRALALAVAKLQQPEKT